MNENFQRMFSGLRILTFVAIIVALAIFGGCASQKAEINFYHDGRPYDMQVLLENDRDYKLGFRLYWLDHEIYNEPSHPLLVSNGVVASLDSLNLQTLMVAPGVYGVTWTRRYGHGDLLFVSSSSFFIVVPNGTVFLKILPNEYRCFSKNGKVLREGPKPLEIRHYDLSESLHFW